MTTYRSESAQAVLQQIHNKTAGRCHICHESVGSVHEYGWRWQKEHVRAKAKGGSNQISNLMPAHGSCNLMKATRTARWARDEFGYDAPPNSIRTATKHRTQAACIGGVVALAILWFSTANVELSLLGALAGAALVCGVVWKKA